jgi:flavin-binding protein dodecin
MVQPRWVRSSRIETGNSGNADGGKRLVARSALSQSCAWPNASAAIIASAAAKSVITQILSSGVCCLGLSEGDRLAMLSGCAWCASKESHMSVAKVSEISSTSKTSFEDAIQQGLARAHKTIRNIRSLWIKEQHARVTDGKISEYQVNMLITFMLDE